MVLIRVEHLSQLRCRYAAISSVSSLHLQKYETFSPKIKFFRTQNKDPDSHNQPNSLSTLAVLCHVMNFNGNIRSQYQTIYISYSNSFFEGHNPFSIFYPPLSCQAPIFFKHFYLTCKMSNPRSSNFLRLQKTTVK